MNFSRTNSVGLLYNKSFFIKIFFYKKIGRGKIFYKNFLDKHFLYSVKDIIFLFKFKFIRIYNILKYYNIYIKIIPKNYIYSGTSISLSLFINFFCLLKNLILKKNILILGNINKFGIIHKVDYIKKKIRNLNLNKYIIILPKNNYKDCIYILNKYNYNNFIIPIFNLKELLKVLNFDFLFGG